MEVVDREYRWRGSKEGRRATSVMEKVDLSSTSVQRQPGCFCPDPHRLHASVQGAHHGRHGFDQLGIGVDKRAQHEQREVEVVRRVVEQRGDEPRHVLLAAPDDAGHEPEQVDAHV